MALVVKPKVMKAFRLIQNYLFNQLAPIARALYIAARSMSPV